MQDIFFEILVTIGGIHTQKDGGQKDGGQKNGAAEKWGWTLPGRPHGARWRAGPR
jgi:hypothetical protein